ncbi:RsmB/NOP family class I SAM-dependent RNA methyltransferase [Arthrobacter russicus]|uniref:16S rRNA (Cytosine967-C5)-methyltransferase n=1 Tax=Arthrobacter russicus TaxID=172040 RepID=A0ABU1JIM2_9MICC|nr:transcription antitermination factor NusB [Arthrobacter russicus]MDR6271217.1 16S rRNA (cytosine967-C5)-methyltransferase [Arthrobacter russicus]
MDDRANGRKHNGQTHKGQGSGPDRRRRDPDGEGRRNNRGRERNRGGNAPRGFSESTPAQRVREADAARLVAFEVLRAVSKDNAYANLVLPAKIRANRLDKRDAGLATELGYGALRAKGSYDAVIAACVDRPLADVDEAILDALRLGAHQLLAMRIPPHAAVNQTVGLARAVIGAGPASFINAVLRKIAAKDLSEWLDELTAGLSDPVKIAAIRQAHPEWIVRALRQSLVAHGRPVEEIDALLEADNAAPVVNLVALPGLGDLAEAFDADFTPGPLVADSALSAGGDPGRLGSIREGVVRVQDVGSQLVARALAAAPLTGTGGAPERWLDLCAGPGGKAALLAALAKQRGATLLANEPAEHRAELVRKALAAVPGELWQLRVADGRTIAEDYPETFDRILVDAPCSGLGALRRRPESRWRRTPAEVAELSQLQRELLVAGLAALKPGGVLGYATCSPHPAETLAVVTDVLRKRDDLELLDAGEVLDGVALKPLHAGQPAAGLGNSGSGASAQLWPHLHATDAMFLTLIRKTNREN